MNVCNHFAGSDVLSLKRRVFQDILQLISYECFVNESCDRVVNTYSLFELMFLSIKIH